MRQRSFWSQRWAQPVVALLLFAAIVSSRLPFMSHMLYAWDSANFALALKYYNVAFHQPHPPGYPLYVGIGYLVNLLVQEANASFVYVSVVTSAAAVVVLFLLASRMYNPCVGLTSAILLGASVGFWGYGEVAYAYTSLAFLGTLVAWLCYLMWQGQRWVAVLCGLVLGLAAGVRQDTLVFLGPLWLVSSLRSGIWRHLLSTLVLGLVVAAWLIPAVQLSGGWDTFQKAGAAQSNYVLTTYSLLAEGPGSVGRNTQTLLLFLKQMFGLTSLVTIYFAGRLLTFEGLVVDHRLSFLLLWFLPPALVYTVIHIGDPGYVLSLLPPLCIATAVGIRDIGRDLRTALLLLSSRFPRLEGLASLAKGTGTAVAVVMLLGLVGWNINAFTRTPGPVRLTEIRTIDTILERQLEYTRSFPPGAVVVLAKERLRQMKYYLPEYDTRLLYDEYQEGYLEARYSYQVPEGVNTVLVMDFGKPSILPQEIVQREVVLTDSPTVSLWRFDVKPGDTIKYGYDYFVVNERS